ncbi:MAG: class I SAM-dependent methyltransferase [Pikeienuella sp.]
MDPVKRQYEAYPYPDRDPADEAKRLVTGSPSDPPEIDHMLFGGARDWRKPFKALVAGGGTGDGLIMLAKKLSTMKVDAEILYLDMSTASREVAEARAAARGLTSITFETGDLLTAPDRGEFDYVDCTGVLHHLPDPQAGFNALARAIAPGGGMGGMVYAPYGRTGVYPLQNALNALTAGQAPQDQVAVVKSVLKGLPRTNWFPQNQNLVDHKQSDAGLYDLLLHSRDRPYTVGELAETLGVAGLHLTGFTEPARYDPRLYLPEAVWPRLDGLDMVAQAALAEQLAGNMKVHVFYACRVEEARGAAVPGPKMRPRLNGLPARAVGSEIARKGVLKIDMDGLKLKREIPRKAGDLISLADGRMQLGQIAQAKGMDWFSFAAAWKPVHDVLCGHNLMRYSDGW